MNESKLDVFLELLDRYYWSKDLSINDRSTNFDADYDELESKILEYKRRYSEAE